MLNRSFNKKNIFNKLLALVMVSSIALSGCGTKSEKDTTKTDSNKEIVLASPRDVAPGKENVHFANVLSYVWEPLVSMNKKGEPTPKLAKSWEMSKDAKEWTFKLQEGVTFHNGEKFNADIVVANFDRYKKLKNGKSNFYTFKVDKIYPGLIDCVKTDDYTVKLNFKKPIPTLAYNMVNFGSPIFHPNDFGKDGNFIVDKPNATGPFKLIESKKNSYCLLEAFDNYWGEKAKSKKIRIKTIPEGQTRYSALKAGEVMGVLDLGAITPNLAEELLKDSKFESSVEKSTINHFLSLNGTKFPFNDPKMKEAVSLAIDRNLIVDKFYKGFGNPTQNLLNHVSPFYKEMKPEHNLEKAKKLASEVLKGKNANVTMIIPSEFTKKYPYKEEAQYIQSVLKELGLNVNINIYDFATFNQIRNKGDFNLQMHIQGLPNMEPYTMFDNYMRSNGSTNKNYHFGYKNDKVDSLMNKLDETLDIEKRAAIYDELQSISAKDPSTIPLFSEMNLIVSNKEVTGHNAFIYGTTLPELQWSK